jgi:hypothetical protein
MMKSICFVLAIFAVMAGYQSPAAAESKDGKSYAKIADGVRSVTLMDKKGGIIGKRFEQHSKEWKAWFEVKKNGGKWELTAKGKSDKNEFVESCDGNCEPAFCP